MFRFDAALVFPGHASQELGSFARPGDAQPPRHGKTAAGGKRVSPITSSSDDVHQHSGWWFPFAILAVIAVLSGIFLLYDLRPGPRSGTRTDDTTPVRLGLGRLELVVPANYLDGRIAREGGPQDALALSALLPDMRGYSAADAQLFQGNPPDSPLVRLYFKNNEAGMNAAERLQRVYGPYLADSKGRDGGFGLTQYAFRPDSGYGNSDLFAGTEGGRLLLFLCERADPQLASPNCLATGQTVGANVSFSWRFKRAYLARWQETSAGVDRLLARFVVHGRTKP
jgi:hypothetical protein